MSGLKRAFFEDDDTTHLDLHVSAETQPGVKALRVTLEAAG